jgi:hypothetical protein
MNTQLGTRTKLALSFGPLSLKLRTFASEYGFSEALNSRVKERLEASAEPPATDQSKGGGEAVSLLSGEGKLAAADNGRNRWPRPKSACRSIEVEQKKGNRWCTSSTKLGKCTVIRLSGIVSPG